MMENIGLGMVGCGGMGIRHLHGLAEISASPYCNVALVAVCDLVEENALSVASEAAKLLGRRPEVFASLEEMIRGVKGIDAVDVVTDSSTHHRLVCCHALEMGKHVIVEKPLALTIRGCNAIIDAASRARKVVAVAENYRRDPLNRLMKALLDADVIGQPYLMIENSVGGRDRIIITPWRHFKDRGGIVFDQGVHHVDVMQYYLGPIERVSGYTGLFEPTRRWADEATPLKPFYEKLSRRVQEEVEATAEDTCLALLRFAAGAVGQWTLFQAGHGRGFMRRTVYGSEGSLDSAGERNGRPATMCLDGEEAISDERILDYVPDFSLDEVTASLYGCDRLWEYRLPFAETDRKLIAIEYHDFARAILEGGEPEVAAEQGRSALAVVYAAFESHSVGRPVTVSEVESGQLRVYQGEIDRALGLD